MGMTKFEKLVAGVCFLGMIGSAHAGVILDEGFNTVVPPGWVAINNSTAPQLTGWFQGNPGVFPAQAGPANSYAAANFNNAAPGGDISNWLLTPVISLSNGEQITFFTRTEPGSLFPDRLEVRLSTNGASTNVGSTTTSVGDFTTLLLVVNPTLSVGGYPENWTQFTLTVAGLGGAVNGRLAFRYQVPDTNTNADYIGIDTVRVAVPEPSTLLVLMLGLTLLGWHLRRARSR